MPDTNSPLTSDICHLTSGDPPRWVADYIGIPFRARGRDRAGVDCWGLVRLVLAERFGLELPSHAEGYEGLEDTAAIEALIGGAAEAGPWRRIPAPEAGDLAVLRGIPTPHIGVVVSSGMMLHALDGAAVSLARLDGPAWRNRLRPSDAAPYAGYYRHQAGLPAVALAKAGEVLPPGAGSWTLSIAPHPFRAERRTLEMPAGISLEEAFARAQPDALCRLFASASIAGQAVPLRRQWKRIRPKPGTAVAMRALPPLPAGGDRKTLRTVALIGLVVAAILVPELALGLSGWQAGLVGASIAIGGGLLVHAFLPVQNRRLDSGASSASSPTFSIEAAQNALRPYAPIPRPLGTHRFVGNLGARTYRQIIAGEVYFRILLIWGYGPLEVTDLQIGETPLEEFDDVEVETRQGFPGDPALTLFTNDVFEEVPGVTLTNELGFATRRSREDSDEIDLDFTFPRGLVWFQEDGDRQPLQVRLMVQYAVAGSGNWSADDLGTAVAAGSFDLGAAPSGAIKYHDPEGSRWDFVTEPRQRTDAVVVDRYSGGLQVITGPDSYRRKRRNFPEKDEWRWVIERPKPAVPTAKVLVAWVLRVLPETGGIPAARITDRRSSPSVQPRDPRRPWDSYLVRPARVAFNTSDVLAATNAIKQPPADYRFRAGEFVSLGTSGTLPGGIPAATTVYVVNPTASTYQLALTPDGDPITIADAGSGTHFISDILGQPEADFEVTTAAPTANTVDHAAGTAAFQGLLVEGNTTSALRVGVNFKVAQGQYDVRVRRVTADRPAEGQIDEVVWTGLRSIAYVDPFTLPGVARSAIRIRATAQLEGRIEPISALLTSLAKVYDGVSAWDDDLPSANPAALFRLVAQDAANKRAYSDAQLDLAAIEAWHEVCEAEGWAFNMVADFRTTVPEMLTMIAAAGMASPAWVDGKLSVVQDVDKTVPVQHITPRNSWSYRGRLRFARKPHAWRVRYLDELAGFGNAERLVYDDGYSAANATEILGLEFPGVTNPDLVWRHARRRIAEARLRPEEHRVVMDVEHLVATRGDMVVLANDAIKVGLGYGRLKAVALGGGGEALSVTLDAAVPMEAGGSYVVRIRDEAGGSLLEAVDNPGAGEYTTLTFTTPVVGPTIAARDVFLFGELGLESRQVIITEIRPDADLNAEVTMIDLAPAVFAADDLALAFGPGDVDSGADTLGPAGHGFVDDDQVRFTTDGTLPAVAPLGDGPGNLIENLPYFVVGAVAASYQVAATEGGAALDLTDGGAGNHQALRVIPAFDAGISADPVLPDLARPAAPVIDEIRSGESVMRLAADGSLEFRIALRFSIPPTATAPDAVEVQYRTAGGLETWRRAAALLLPLEEVFVTEVEQQVAYDLRLRTITAAGIPSDWTTELDYVVVGASAPPPDVDTVFVNGDMLEWELDSPPLDLAGFRVKWHEGTDQTWPTGKLLAASLFAGNQASIASLRGSTRTLMVKAVDRYGNESAAAANVTLDLAFVFARDPVALESRDLKAEGFPGTLSGATAAGSGPAATLDLAGGNHGTLVGGPAWLRGLAAASSGSASALGFDGGDRYVSMGDVHDFAGTAAFTVACRFRARIPTTLGDGNHYILATKRESGGANGYVLWISASAASNGELRALRHGGGSDTELIGPMLEDQREYVAAMVYDGSDFRLVLDGATVAGPSASSQSIVNHAGDFRVAKDSNVGGFRMDGAIDEVQVWDVARSDAQIAADFAEVLEGQALADAVAAGLVGYWPFEEGIIDGELEALPLRASWVPDGDALPTWEQDDADPGWAEIHLAVLYDFSHAPSSALLPGNLRRDATTQARALGFLVATETPPSWPEPLDSGSTWGALDAAPGWEPQPGFQNWPARILDASRQAYPFRIAMGAGIRQAVISALALTLEGIETEVAFEDFTVAAGGSRLPLPGPYHAVTELRVTLQDDGGSALTVKVADRDPLLGPLLIARDSAGASTSATVDVVLIGVPK